MHFDQGTVNGVNSNVMPRERGTENDKKINDIQEDITMIKLDKKHSGVFAAGVLFGTAGIKILSSKDAKKVYTNCTAAVLRAKDCVMKTVSKVQENAEDIYAEAQQINEDRAAAEEAFEDTAEEESFKETEETAAEEE